MPSFSPSRRDFSLFLLAAGAGSLAVASPAKAASIVPSGSRVCATCAFWKGPRLPSMNRQSVIIADGARGLCTNAQSPWGGVVTTPQQGAPEHWRRAVGLV